MNPSEPVQIRRATLEDVPALTAFWRQTGLPAEELEKCFTEFQVAEGPEGAFLGAFALRVENKEGLLHSEAYATPAWRDYIRPLFGERILNLSRNLGLFRLWVQADDNFWRESGFQTPLPDVAVKAPVEFGVTDSGWLMAQLREEAAARLDKEVEMLFDMARKESAEDLKRQVRSLKLLVIVLGAVVLGLLALLGWHVIRAAAPRIFRR